MKRPDEIVISDYIFKAACFSFVFGVFTGAGLNVWAYCMIFWGRDSACDFGLVISVISMLICGVAVLAVLRREEAKINE